MPIITLLSDFGLSDYFVGAVKGVMLSLNPDVAFVDISHQVPPQDIFTGAFTLSQAYSCFPQGTVHFAVVDPGVGTTRKALAAMAAGPVIGRRRSLPISDHVPELMMSALAALVTGAAA